MAKGDIKSKGMLFKAIAHCRGKGYEFELFPIPILHKVDKRRVQGLAVYHRWPNGRLDTPLRLVWNVLCRGRKEPHCGFDADVMEKWSLPVSDALAIQQATLDSPYATEEDRVDLLRACGLKEIPLTKRPFVKRPKT